MAQALRVDEPGSPTWGELIDAGEKLENVADRAYVLTYLASCLPSNRRGRRDRLYAAATEITDSLKSTEDKYHRYYTVANLAAEKDRPLATRALKKAYETVVHTRGRRGTFHEHRLVDLAYRVDPELPMKFAMFHDDDPARDEYRERVKKQINRNQLKADIGDPRSEVDFGKMRDNPNLASAAWQAIGGLNSGRLVATDIVRLRDMLVCASNYPLDTAYPMYSWVITNVMMKYADSKDSKNYIREIFEGFVRGSDFGILTSGNEQDAGIHPKWEDRGEVGSHILVLPGERDRGMEFICDWIREKSDDYVVIVDPYYGPEQLDFVVQIMDIQPSLVIKILTSKKHNSKHAGGISDTYLAAWRDLCDQSPPDTEILVVGIEGTGEAPFHDRWILSQSAGLRLGTSLNSLGVRDTEISMLGSDEVGKIGFAMERYLKKEERRMPDGRRIRYESFEL